MYPTCMRKGEVLWPIGEGDFDYKQKLEDDIEYGIYRVSIQGQPEKKKDATCTHLFRYNRDCYYTHFDIKRARKIGLEVSLINESPNALIYERENCMTGEDMFGKWYDSLIEIKRGGGHSGKAAKELLVSLWGVLCEERNGKFYGPHPRIKPFLLAFARKVISETVQIFGEEVKRIHTDGFIISNNEWHDLEFLQKNGLEIKKRGKYIVKNCNSVE